MTREPSDPYYRVPPPGDRPGRQLVADQGTPREKRYTFFDRLEIGRYHPGREASSGILLVQDGAASSRHCIITQTHDGRCFVRDVSRNGTRVDGRRLVPNIEVEIKPGQRLQVGFAQEFVLAEERVGTTQTVDLSGMTATRALSGLSMVTVLVGDIRNYTVMVREAKSAQLQQSVRKVFTALEREVERHGGTLKEYQGDAIFAFWERGSNDDYAAAACRAALALDRMARELAEDAAVWNVEGYALEMDWALATGPVLIDTMGGDRPTGLSMVGEAVVMAYRTEKMADDTTGRILADGVTQQTAAAAFRFAPLGEREAKGFKEAPKVFSLLGAIES